MDSIDVVLETDTHTGDGKVLEVPDTYITLILNGEKVEGNFDPLEFALPKMKNANWFLKTCSCGIAGCAGYEYGVNVKRRAKSVEWRDHEVSNPRGITTFPKRFYKFNRTTYEAVQDKCMQMIRAVVTERETASIDVHDFEWRDNLIPWYTIEKLERAIVRYEEYIMKYGESWAW